MKAKQSEWFAMRIDPQTRKNLESVSEKTGLSQAAVIRLLINQTGGKIVIFDQRPAPQGEHEKPA